MSNLDGATYAAFTIELSVASTETIQVEWFTEDGTAKAGTDYEATTGLLTFQPGELSKQVQVLVFGRDPADTQEDRNFHMRVKPPINAILGTSLTDVVITILDNEGTAIAALIVPSGPKGGKGDTGLSAYEEAFLQDPSVGTLTEWLESLKGEGRLIELQKGATAIQWRYVGDIPWIDLVQLADLKGGKGDDGPAIQMQATSTQIQWRVTGTTVWNNLIAVADLKGAKGDTGASLTNRGVWAAKTYNPGDYTFSASSTGSNNSLWFLLDTAPYASTVMPKSDLTHWQELAAPAGVPGNSVELQKSATAIQWRQVGSATWTDLVLLADLQGANGKNVELQKSATAIQWRNTGDTSWLDLVLLTVLKGDAGQNIELQKTATYIQWRVVGAADWTNLVALADITGPAGSNPAGALLAANMFSEFSSMGAATLQTLANNANLLSAYTPSSDTAATSLDHVSITGKNQFLTISTVMSDHPVSGTIAQADVLLNIRRRFNAGAAVTQVLFATSGLVYWRSGTGGDGNWSWKLTTSPLPNGWRLMFDSANPPTALQVGALPMCGELPMAANINDYGPISTYIGLWGKNTSVNATIANGFPEDNAVGMLEVFPYNQYRGMQRYTVRGGKQYLRNLTANWLASAPAWSEWYSVASSAFAVRAILASTENLNDINTITRLGTYRSNGGTVANNFPYEGFVGTIEVVQGYSYAVQQFAVSNYGNTYVRNSVNPTVWTAWLNTSIQCVISHFDGNVDTLLDDGDYPTRAATTGLPDPALFGVATQLDNCRLVVRSLRNKTSITQEWTAYRSSVTADNGRRFHREKYGSGAWTPWREILDTSSISTLYGIGGLSTVATAALDWQQFDFTTGATYLATLSNTSNIPAAISAAYPAATSLYIRVLGGNGASRLTLEITPDLTANTNYRRLNVMFSGAKGSRAFFTRQVFTSADAIPIANGGTGATTLELAQAALGINPTFLDATANLNTALANAPFTWNNTTTNTPVAASYGRGFTVASSATDLTQFAIINGTNSMYVRYFTAGAWGEWLPFYASSQEGKDALRADIAATPAGVREFMEQYGITATFNNAATDLNLVLRGVLFTWINTTLNTPVAASYGRGFCIASDPQNITQFAIINGTGAIWMRFATTVSGAISWGAWTALNTGGGALPYLQYSNPGGGTFAAASYSPIPFYTSVEANGITLANAGSPSGASITVAAAGLYQFELEVRINGGATGHMAVGSAFGLSLDTITVPTALRAGFSVADTVGATTVARLVCTERLTASAVRRVYLWNSTAATTLIATAVIKVTRLGA